MQLLVHLQPQTIQTLAVVPLEAVVVVLVAAVALLQRQPLPHPQLIAAKATA